MGVELSRTIASHKTLTLVVGMTMILDDFLKQWMLQKIIILFYLNFLTLIDICFEIESISSSKIRCLYTIQIKTWCNRFVFIHRHLPYILIDFKSTYLL